MGPIESDRIPGMTNTARSGLPIIGQLSRLSATFLVGTVVLSLAAIVLDYGLHVDETVLFVVSAAAILGLAWVVGLSTERLGSITGPQVGGILNATFGNIAELIIGFLALQAGLIEVVKASLTGSIIGNLLLVMGLSALIGGLKNGSQHFSPKIAVSNAALLVLAVIGLFVPAIFALTTKDRTPGSITQESVLVAGVLIVGYVLSLAYQFTHPDTTSGGAEAADEQGGPSWSGRTAIVVLLGAAALLAVLSEILVSSITPFIATFNLSFFFVGVVIIPTIGNLAEHLVSVQLAAKNKMEFALAVTFGSSLQIALFVAPALVLLGALIGQDMNLVFTPLEIAAVAAAVGISSLIAIDGETNWLEGALLTLVYAILAISFFEFVADVAT
jgi:Ca2+:H+ antiporter